MRTSLIIGSIFFSVLMEAVRFQAFGAVHIEHEKTYQQAWCSKAKGVTEYRLKDKTRVDCLTEKYAVEFDFASKWHEAVGQALYYARMTGKKPAIVLIIERDTDWRFYDRLKTASRRTGIKIWFTGPWAL